MSSSLPENLIDQQPQPAQRARAPQHPMFIWLRRMEAACAAGVPFSDVAQAVAVNTLNHLNDRREYRKGREFLRRRIRRGASSGLVSEKAITKALDELCADGPFKIFERHRRANGANVYEFIQTDPEEFIRARDAGRARRATRARTYYVDEGQQRQRLDWQRQRFVDQTMTEEQYLARMAEQDVKARTLTNGRVLPECVLDDVVPSHWRGQRRRAIRSAS